MNWLENFRTSSIETIETRKNKTQAEIKSETPQMLSDDSNLPERAEEDAKGILDELSNAFKYLEIFTLTILLFIFGIKLLFYGVLIFLVLLIGRFFWYRIY